jgi:hypothetical protein
VPPSSRPPEPIDQSAAPSCDLVIKQAASARRAAAPRLLAPAPCPILARFLRQTRLEMWIGGDCGATQPMEKYRTGCVTAGGMGAALARKEQAEVHDDHRLSAASAAVALWPERVLPSDPGASYWTPTRPTRDLVQLRVRQGQWENCLPTGIVTVWPWRGVPCGLRFLASNFHARPGRRR